MTAAGRLAASLLLLAAACFEGAVGQQPQLGHAPILMDTVAVRRLLVFYTAAPLPEDRDAPQVACLLGSVDSTPEIVVDSIRVADRCDAQPQVVGGLGAWKNTEYWTDQEVTALIEHLCDLLRRSPPSVHIIGVVHGIVPWLRPDGTPGRAPLVWACWRP